MAVPHEVEDDAEQPERADMRGHGDGGAGDEEGHGQGEVPVAGEAVDQHACKRKSVAVKVEGFA